MINSYLDKLAQSTTISEIKSLLYVFGISNNYKKIKEYCNESTLIFVDEHNSAWTEYQQVQINDLAQIGDILEKLPEDFCKTVVIDSTDKIAGDLKAAFARCAMKRINVMVVAGMNQSGGFYNFRRFLEKRADKIFTERGIEMNENKLYEQALSRSNGRCEVCGKQANLHLHHILFGKGKRNQQERLETVIMLCVGCHQEENGVHGKNGEVLNLQLKIKVQDYYKAQGYTEDKIRELMGGRLYGND